MGISSRKNLKVFISYCHESKEHEKSVLALADRLCEDGLDCNIDQYIDFPRQGWPRWMEEQIRISDYVLVVCTEIYDKRARGDEIPGIGKGIRFESLLTYQDIYENDSINEKFIPIILDRKDSKFIPKPLRPFQYYQIDTDKGYEALYRRLIRRPLIVKPKLGKVKQLPTGINLGQKFGIVNSTNDKSKTHKPKTRLKKLELELTINRDFDLFTERERKNLLAAIARLLEINSDLKINKMTRGSVKISLELRPREAGELLAAIEDGKLKKHDVVAAKIEEKGSIDREWIASRREAIKSYLWKKWNLSGNDLEEVTQETMLEALQLLTYYKGYKTAEPGTYLIDIAKKIVQSYFRRRDRHERHRVSIELAESIGVNFRDEAEVEELAQIMREKFSMLPDKYIQVLRLVYYQDYKESEAAKELGIPVDALYRLKANAIKQLQKLFAKDPRFKK